MSCRSRIERQRSCPILSKVSLRFLLVVGVACLTGCPDSAGPKTLVPAEAPFAGVDVEIAVPKALHFTSVWPPLLDEWSARTSASYKLATFELTAQSAQEAANGAVKSSFVTNVNGITDSANVVVLPITSIAEFAASGRLAPIPQDQCSAENLDWLDVLPGLRDRVAAVAGRPTVVPLSSPVLVCYFRRDLLNTAGFEAPQTWADYQKLLDRLEQWAPGLTAVEPWGSDYRATTFLARAAAYVKHPGNYSLFFDIASGEPLIGTAGFVQALTDAQTALSNMPPDVAQYSPGDCRREILSGKAAIAITLESAPGSLPLPFGPAVADVAGEPSASATGGAAAPRPESVQIGFCRLPGVEKSFNLATDRWEAMPDGGVNSVTLTAFTGLCVGVSGKSSSERAQAAWNLVTTLTMSEVDTAFPATVRTLCRESDRATASQALGSEMTDEEKQNYLHAVASSLRDSRVVAELPVVGGRAFHAALTKGLGLVLSGASSPEQALAAVAQDWKTLSEHIGPDTVRDSYRRSLGLMSLSKK